MKPCAQLRESVALLACGALPSGEAADLRGHLQRCDGCRDYFSQMTVVCESHTAAALGLSDTAVSPSLRRRIAEAVSAGVTRPQTEPLPAGLTGLRWLAGVAALLVLLLGGSALVRRSAAPVKLVEAPVVSPAGIANSQGESINLNAYRLALNRSPDDLEQLLAREAARPTANPVATLQPSLAVLEPYTLGMRHGE